MSRSPCAQPAICRSCNSSRLLHFRARAAAVHKLWPMPSKLPGLSSLLFAYEHQVRLASSSGHISACFLRRPPPPSCPSPYDERIFTTRPTPRTSNSKAIRQGRSSDYRNAKCETTSDIYGNCTTTVTKTETPMYSSDHQVRVSTPCAFYRQVQQRPEGPRIRQVFL